MYFMYFTTIRAILKVIASSNTLRCSSEAYPDDILMYFDEYKAVWMSLIHSDYSQRTC